MMKIGQKISLILGLSIGLLLVGVQNAAAVSMCVVNPVVTSYADAGSGSLRLAVSRACSGSTITFNLNRKGNTIYLSSGQIVIDKSLTIQGPGATVLTVRNSMVQSAISRVFLVNPGVTAAISGLTI